MKFHNSTIYFGALFVLAAVWLGGCAKQGAPQSPARVQDGGAALLMELDARFDRDTAARGVDGWVSYFADNGAMGSADGPPVSGRDAIGQAMKDAFATPGFSLRWKPDYARILVPSKLGYTSGTFTSTRLNERGEKVTKTGVYITVWRKQKDGAWKIEFDTGENGDAAPVVRP
jgi:ketosteroid isomerase-like protein